VEIVVVPVNPLDVRPESLTDLVEAIGATGYPVRLGSSDYDPRRPAISPWETIIVQLPWHDMALQAAKGAGVAVAAAAVAWAKKRIQAAPQPRPIAVDLLAGDGRCFKRISLSAKDVKVVIEEFDAPDVATDAHEPHVKPEV
jgi:hypothetical protein